MGRPSVVVSTFRRDALLARVLHRLDSQTRPADDVIVAVDRAQQDLTTIERIAAGRARVVQAEQRVGVSASRNAGWRQAGTPVVLFLGDDMLPAPDLVERHLALHAARPDPQVGGLGHVRWSSELE